MPTLSYVVPLPNLVVDADSVRWCSTMALYQESLQTGYMFRNRLSSKQISLYVLTAARQISHLLIAMPGLNRHVGQHHHTPLPWLHAQ